MMKKIIFVVCILSCVLFGCAKKNDNSDSLNKIREEEIEADVELEKAEEERDKVIDIESSFNDGYAWISVNHNEWYCINEKGEEVFKLDKKLGTPNNFTNGYSIVDDKYVIDITGKVVYTIDDSEYQIYDEQPLEVDCIVLSKEVDEYERSGVFYYVLNLKSQNIEEIDLRNCNYYTQDDYEYEGNGIGVSKFAAKLGKYIGCGKYTIVLRPNSYNEEEWGPWVYSTIQIFDVATNSLQECSLEKQYSPSSIDRTNIEFYDTDDDKIKYVMFENVWNGYELLKFDVEKCQIIERVVENDPIVEKIKDFWSHTIDETDLIGTNLLKLVCKNEDSDEAYLKYIDLYTDKIYQLNTEYEDSNAYEMEYSVMAYKDGIFILNMKNDAGTVYFSIVDEAGNTILKTTKYDYSGGFLPQFIGKNVVYYDGENFCFLDSESGEMLNQLQMKSTIYGSKKIPDSMCCSVGDKGIFIHTENTGGMYSIYDASGSKLLGEGEAPSVNGDSQLYYEVYHSGSNESDEFWDWEGNKLKIKLKD